MASRRLPRPDPMPGAPGPTGPKLPPVPSVLVYGDNRPLVNLLLYALGEEADPSLHWLEIRGPSDEPSEWDPVRLGWVPPGHAWSTDPHEGLAPDHARANAAIFELVRSDEPPVTLTRLAEFLRLPEPMQRILGEMEPPNGSRLLAVANTDRIQGSLPEPVLGPILDAFEWVRCSLFVGHTGPNPPAISRFTHVVRIEGDSPERWPQARIHFEREALFEGARVSGVASPSDLPSVERVFRRAVR
jgi:hypothetical protein